MGQRHQTFCVIFNPYIKAKKALSQVTKEQKRNDLSYYVEKEKELTKMKKEFGTGDKTVLAFHHQWLYGATALAIAYNFLEFSKEKKHDEYSNPFNKEFAMEGKDIVNLVKNILCIHRFIPDFSGRESGFENFHYLNTDEPEVREDCTAVDNNDGITIIDTTIGKYCFMNIGSGDFTIRKAQKMIPLSANDYLRCYYPKGISDESVEDKKEIENLIGEEKDKKLNGYENNIKLHEKANELFSKFNVLSLDELCDIFPKVFKKNKVEKNELV